MHKRSFQAATLTNIDGNHLPPVETQVDARYQMAVTCGAQAAIAFFGEDHSVSLHAHLPASLAYFLKQSRLSAAALGVEFEDYRQACTDAFVAGYLGRIQQELRIIRPPLHHYGNAAAMH
ncbi:hypothetical protein ACO0K0_12095 [Undibacterium sp. SXout11W]|uniref:hypothetical protein n=1 Tax=Undibacterium sp. SXout11W TaxID=3413050 RepID=UPI003BEFF7A8